MSTVTDITIERVGKVIRKDLNAYLNEYNDFIKTDYAKIYAYKKGDTKDKNSDAVKRFNDLLLESEKIEDAISNTDISLGRYDEWDLIESLDEIKIQLDKINVLDRILRVSTFTDGSSESAFQNDVTMSNQDTPESIVAKDRLNADDEWVEVFLNNKISETDYRANVGGQYVKFGSINNENVFLASVVDNLEGDKVYGKDIDNNFHFADDDISVLSPDKTLVQAASVLLALIKGDVPEFPQLGKTPDLAVGGNAGLINIVFMKSDIVEIFSSDDTFTNILITDVKRDGDSLFVSVSIESFRNKLIEKDLKL